MCAFGFDLRAIGLEQRADRLELRPSRIESREFCVAARIEVRIIRLELRTAGRHRKFSDQFFGVGPADPEFDRSDGKQIAFAQAGFGDRIAVEPGAPIQGLDDDLWTVVK